MKKITISVCITFVMMLCSGSITFAQSDHSSRRAGEKMTTRELKSSKAVWDVLYTVDGASNGNGFFAPFLWDGDLYVSRWSPAATGNEAGKVYKFEWIGNSWSNTGTITVPGVTGGYIISKVLPPTDNLFMR